MNKNKQFKCLLLFARPQMDLLFEVVSKALATTDVSLVRLNDSMFPGSIIRESIQRAIEKADILIADVRACVRRIPGADQGTILLR